MAKTLDVDNTTVTNRNNTSSKTPKQPKKVKKARTAGQRIALWAIVLILIGLITAIGVIWFLYQQNHDSSQTDFERVEFPDPIYSTLTGEEISDANINQMPTYCIQIPNGLDGSRPQAGLNQAAIVFEAIAEAGITRFAAIFQNPNISAIGPIRSLRPYYLEWDTPFDCTIVHAGGSDEALEALQLGGQRELDESESYMWREYNTDRGWNNLFTSSANLAQFNSSRGYDTSNIKAFARLTPEEVDGQLQDLQNCVSEETCAGVNHIEINFGAVPSYNLIYTYNTESNSYTRAYANGETHLTYMCPEGLEEPVTATQCGEPEPVTPKVVIAMVVNESLMADGYHEDITTTGTGNAVIFQNGLAIEATWSKSSQNNQIIFRDSAGAEIKLTPGQTWISAIPQYGSIVY